MAIECQPGVIRRGCDDRLFAVGSGPVIGIDLGTTNSVVAVVMDGVPTPLLSAEGAPTTPSVVHYPAEGPPIVGHAAREYRITDPVNTIFSVKRLIGQDFRSQAILIPRTVTYK